MMLEALYLKSLEGFGRRMFTPAEFSGLHGLSAQSSKVLLYRMKKSRQLFGSGRGRYRLLSAEGFLKLQALAKRDSMLHSIAVELLERFPDLEALALYGSHVRGDADRYSDYDVLLIVPERTVETAELRKEIGTKLGIKLHLTVYSGNGYRNAVLSEPYLRFWLSEALVFDEGGIMRAPLPPIPKMAYEEWLSTALAYIRAAEEADTALRRCKHFLTALEILGLIRSALGLSYDFGAVKERLAGLAGRGTVGRIRAGRRPLRGDGLHLEEICRKEVAAISAILGRMGDNEADLIWKGRLMGVGV